MMTGMTTATTSPTVALVTAAAVVGAGFAYWSSASNTTALGTIVFEILRVTGTLGEIGNNKKNCDKRGSNKEKDQEDEFNEAYAAWLDREENETNFCRPENNSGRSEEEDLTDPIWMGETVRHFLLSRHSAATVTKRKVTCAVTEEEASKELGIVKEKALSAISNFTHDDKEILSERFFRRCFQSLQKATKGIVEKEPDIREDYFNGIVVDEINDSREEEKKTHRLRSISFSSSSSFYSATSSSIASYEVNNDNCIVEDEAEVERLLTYLRLVAFAKEEALSASRSSTKYIGHDTRNLRWRTERIVPDAEGYKHLRSVLVEIQDTTETQKPKLGYTVAVHRDRKELVVAVHYEESSNTFSAENSRNRTKATLMSSFLLQQRDHRAKDADSTPSSSSHIDQAVMSLYNEILHFLDTKMERGNDESSLLSSEYSLVLCGHSFGAALACRLGCKLKHHNRKTFSEAFDVHVYAFGPPPCLQSLQTNVDNGSDSHEDYPYITSIVNNHDCIPRWTDSNLIRLQMALRWTMDRKKYHFQRYFNRYNRSQSSTKSVVSSKANLGRKAPWVPPFYVSSRDWNTFWNSSQEPNHTFLHDEASPKYIVPGKVVLIWNHSKDPTIIGAKVHVASRHRNCGKFQQQLMHDYDMSRKNDVLGRLWVDRSMFSDHTMESYQSTLELLLGQVANTI